MLILSLGCSIRTPEAQNDETGFAPLLKGNDIDDWYRKLRKDNESLAREVFHIEDGVLHVFNDSFPSEYQLNTGDNHTHGLLFSKKHYSRFILRFEYKWGERIANNFDEWQYDAGLYYHVTNDDIWPTGIEYQIRYDHRANRNHTGDLIRPDGIEYDWHQDPENNTYLHPVSYTHLTLPTIA